jgi:hypothetical protein
MTAPAAAPAVDLDELAVSLAQQAAALSRLVFNQAELGMTRSESSLLVTLRGGPQRITALAEIEGLAQPTVTVLVKRLATTRWRSGVSATGRGCGPDWRSCPISSWRRWSMPAMRSRS